MSPTPIEATAETPAAKPGQLLAGVARIDITGKGDLPPGDTLYAKALVLKQGDSKLSLNPTRNQMQTQPIFMRHF
jgi:hypothetical protein